ncbi:hypothetical protein J7E87_12870 [Streptomyces sp. ISL-1]|uniref:hypothetical protein n=1 Tax=Streptomyces sp. ISL-1 TaxID=2817657 RepID=UPI001BE84881|nr:hypothetical protein [Streptomyces sp. ISL-1]MBT2390292.1 hypothetical protein [Streptomyces sp. ISL-1]
MTNRKILAVAALCVTAAVGLTACGGGQSEDTADKAASSPPSPKAPVDPFEGLTADQIADKALKATKAANSLKVAGEGKDDGKDLSLEFALSKAGDCASRGHRPAHRPDLRPGQGQSSRFLSRDSVSHRGPLAPGTVSGPRQLLRGVRKRHRPPRLHHCDLRRYGPACRWETIKLFPGNDLLRRRVGADQWCRVGMSREQEDRFPPGCSATVT